MTSLNFSINDIPSMSGRTAIVTGGASGIGFAAIKHMAGKGAKTYILDLNPPEEELPQGSEFVKCDITSWDDLVSAFQFAGDPDIAVANAGVSEECNYFEDTFDKDGKLQEPKYQTLEINYRAVLNFTKLSISAMRRRGGGSIVITSSATAYAPEQSLPVYSSTKLGLIGLVRALRPSLHLENITINAVAPAATITKLLPRNLAIPLMAAGMPVSSAEFVGLAIVYAATAEQQHPVEAYGKDSDDGAPGQWNGRTILTLGDTYTELEESIAKLRPEWFGKDNTRLTRLQQAATDFRPVNLPN